MRLLTKSTLYFLAALVPLLIGAGVYLYHRFSDELNQRMDQELITEEIQWIRYLRTQIANGTSFYLSTPEILISPINATPTKFPTFETTSGLDAKDNKRIPFRQLTHVASIDGVTYLLTIRRSQEQRTVLVENITQVMLIVFVTFFLITLLLNWLISQSIWKPFRRSLKKINDAELQKMQTIHFEKTNIQEFNELNSALNQMTGKIHRDYISIKEFTENAAHEMQTPLAIVHSKLELLLQDENLKEMQSDLIVQATEGLNRLNKLNQSLLLLAKIDNNQYPTQEVISLKEIIKKYLKLFDSFIREKEITVEENYTGDWQLHLHPLLADSLVSNLLGNAVKYNYKGGKISVSLTNKILEIANTSHLPPIDPQQLFKRFYKSKFDGHNSTGLGLAIVKKICDTHHLNISYHAENNFHQFRIQKESESGVPI